MANSKGVTLTKADLARYKSDASMSAAKRKAISKALVDANTAANNIAPSRQKKKA